MVRLSEGDRQNGRKRERETDRQTDGGRNEIGKEGESDR